MFLRLPTTRCRRAPGWTSWTHQIPKTANLSSSSLQNLSSTWQEVYSDEECLMLGSSRANPVRIRNFLSRGPVPYPWGWAWQQVVLRQRLLLSKQNQKSHDQIILLEHSPVYTLGRGADENHLTFLKDATTHNAARAALCRPSKNSSSTSSSRLGSARLSSDRLVSSSSSSSATASGTLQQQVDALCQDIHGEKSGVCMVQAPNGAPIYRIERGGEVTFHGPGQLVCYPLLDLTNYTKDLHWYLRQVEEVIMQTLQHYGIHDACRDDINTGVWVQENKIAAVGVSASRWITTHGFALNVDPDLSFFDNNVMLPCGVEGRGVTTMAQVLRERQHPLPSMQQVANQVMDSFATVFECQCVQAVEEDGVHTSKR